MKRVITSFAATVAALVALLGFKTHTPEVHTAAASTDTSTTADTSTSTSTSGNTAASMASSPAKSSSTASTSTTVKAASSATKTIAGSSVNTRWGTVQVQLTVNGSKITKVDVLQYPQGNNRDLEINSYAVPQLESEALSAQSANIDSVSGATVTSNGFISSLQSALNKM